MAMPSHRGGISFGLLYIPIALYTATQDNDIHFKQLCKGEDGGLSQIKYKKICASCGKEVTADDIIRGYEYDKGQFVTVSDAEIEKIKTELDKTIQILHFADLTDIPPIYFDKTYHVIPEPGAEKAYELLRVLMQEEQKVAIAKVTMREKESLLALLATKEGILAESLFFADEVRNQPKVVSHPQLEEAEKEAGRKLLSAYVKPFGPELYHNEFQERLRGLIQQKIEGKEVVQPILEGSPKIINIMEALQKSLDQQKEPAKKPRSSRKKTKGA